MGSEKGYFGTPENSLLRRGAAAVVAGMLALSLSACKTTNATGSNSGSEVSTSVNDGGTSAGVSNGNEAAPGTGHNNSKWETVEATAETNTDPRKGFAVVDGVLTVCMGNNLYAFDSPDQTVSPISLTSENLVSANDPDCVGSRPDSSDGWIEFKIGGETSTNPESFISCVQYEENGEDKKAEVYALGNGDPITLRGGCPFTRETNS